MNFGPQSQDAFLVNYKANDVNNEDNIITLMTYNIRYGLGIDNVLNIERIIETINNEKPDIIALNEVDNFMPRSHLKRQDKLIADRLGYGYVYGYNINVGSKYGNVLLSKYPINSWKNHRLPGLDSVFAEPRGIIEADIDVEGKSITVLVTHLSINTKERAKQVEFIVKKLEEIPNPKILMGDFNDVPESEGMKKIFLNINDTAEFEYYTFPTEDPKSRTDYILVSDDIFVKESKPINSYASDHLPVLAKIKITGTELLGGGSSTSKSMDKKHGDGSSASRVKRMTVRESDGTVPVLFRESTSNRPLREL